MHTGTEPVPYIPSKSRKTQPYGFNHVAFNRFLFVPDAGNEPDFLSGKVLGAADGFYAPMRGVLDGNKLLLRVYVHNCADPSLNGPGVGIARNTRVRVNLPEGADDVQVVSASISADNARPQMIESSMEITAEHPFVLEYESGSGSVKGNCVDAPLSDDLVSSGVAVGDLDPHDGIVRACFGNIVLVTLRVCVRFVY